MKKRILASFMALCLIVGLLPTAVLAVEEPGNAPPQACTCKTRCAEDTVDETCPVCAVDYTVCTYEAPTGPEESPAKEKVCGNFSGCVDGTHDPECPLYTAPAEPPAPAPEVIPPEIPGEVQAFLDAAEALDPEQPDTIEAAWTAYEALSEEQQAREDVSKGHEALMAAEELLAAAMNAVPVEEGGVYVSEHGSDEMNKGDGSQTKPYATLAKAVEMAEDGATIYLLSDLEITKNARITDKHLTITSAEGKTYTLTRGTDFELTSDNHQSHYNPGFIEVTTNGSEASENASSVTLTNIILDDEGMHEGTYFAQTNVNVTGETNGNLDHVQDSMITAHGLENRAVHIILSDGAELKDFGGMSAVYGTTNAHITMENGSLICDEIVTNRNASATKKAPGETGPAGAVWLQGAEFVMEDGAEISNVIGRAVYVDSGEASIGGTIEYITSDADMWWGTSGLALHLRNNAAATVSGTVSDLTFTKDGCAIEVLESTLHMTKTSVLSNSKNGISISSSQSVQLDGEITGCVGGGHVLTMQGNGSPMNCTIGKTGYIHDNECSYGVIYIQAPSGVLNIYGKINNNKTNDRAGAIALAHNFQGHTVTMYDGAEMIGNSSTETGGAVMVSGGTFIMEGGTISQNSAGHEGGGIFVRNGGTFIMKGGIISNNKTDRLGGGLAFQATDWGNPPLIPNVELLGGEISSNIDKNGANDIAVMSSGDSYIARSIFISENQHISVPAISFAANQKTITLDADSMNTRLGNANSDSISALTAASTGKGWNSPAATFWTQRNDAASMTIGGLTLNSNLPVYVLTQKTDADGKPAGNSVVNFYSAKLTNDTVEITIPAGDMSGSGCAVAIVQPTAYYGSVVIDGPERLNEVPGATSYDVPYTATYTMSESFKNMIEQGQAGITNNNCSFTFVVQLDHRLTAKTGAQDYTFTSPIFVVDRISNEGSTLTVTCKLKDDWKEHIGELTTNPMTLTGAGVLKAADFEDGGLLTTTGSIEVEALSRSITIPANICQTMMVKQKTFTVSFNSGGGTEIPSQTVIAGQKANKPADPTQEGYKFDGWYLGEAEYNFSTPVNQNIILTARWSRHSGGGGSTTRYTIEADAGRGGSISPSGKVRVDRNDDQTFRITADQGYVISDVLVDGKSVGAVSRYIFENVHRDHTIEAVFAVAEKIPSVADPDDTGVSGWLNTHDHMAYLSGYTDGNFGPDDNMTRAQAAQMFYRLLLEKDVPITVQFSDVPADAWYATAVNTLASLGIVNGIGNHQFAPERQVTRAEFTAIAMRFGKLDTSGSNIFTDVKADDWFYDQVVGAIKYGWIGGYADGTFRPNNTITRAEVTVIVNRMLGRAADPDFLAAHAGELRKFSDVPASYWGYEQIMEATNAHEYRSSSGGEKWTDLVD